MTLIAAAAALDALAAGDRPASGDVVAGALALKTLLEQGRLERDLADAALGLEAVATGRPLNLDYTGRARAADLATKVRELISRRQSEHGSTP